ncbi:N-acetylglucosamine-1-phosphotransferase subunit gamma-like isoform X1 [Argiope bruennichi]|uniref:N-acetylglucosamine-1-phosphotransferase subunit gamma-like isoform X1 n=1 Tax=Argiope bruennichi TaxID=94029 RepID=UPI0024943B75|nr:N-acetylglucosamine-1-phosphotransferase subunit gamma-like isoform X1 [Argiope bruennichi]
MILGHLFVLGFLCSVTAASLVQMRVVTETANYGYFANSVDVENPNKLVPSVSPANFSGPELFHRLLGKCYNLTEERYRYTFCPFQNFTQYEISPRWNAYQGILGIWSHWHIENNTFAAMVFKNGDQCGDIDRSVKVSLKCGPNETLLNVTEPTRCQYSALFRTRYVCHKDALVVYPRLSSELQKEWNHLLTELHYGDITKKGYQVGLEKIFQKAGLADTNPTKRPETTTTATSLKEGDTFIDLQTCNKQYKNLKDEIARLSLELEAMKLMLDLSKMHNRTNKPFRVTSSQ